jgi:cellulose synthase/poly-beta-1,6-N-acetylglucosamine synthase-like glycosyltransferase
LRWPRAKLEIKLVCEDGDDETLNALSEQKLDRRFEIVTVPNTGPQTKPKALNFALPFCTGSLICLFDAEDRPHREQLEEAWLTAQFHLEFAALFHGIHQLLARRGLPLPLGGTSTHFRRSAIVACGGWDSHNVTEDADLGFRLWRSGFRIGVLTRPTLEDAPDSVGVWLRQRTRWIKGWMQTWIVRTRRASPPADSRGWAGSLVIHVLLAGTVMCALFFPVTLVTIAVLSYVAISSGQLPVSYNALFAIDAFNILASFAGYALLCLRTVHRRERGLAIRSIPAIPLYWLLLGTAGWRAFEQYLRAPFLWEKTPHKAYDPENEFHRR